MTPPPEVRRTAVVLGVAWVVLCAAVLGIGWLLTHPLEASVGAWDDDVARAIAQRRTDSLDGVADRGTLLADTPVGMGVAVVAGALLSLWRRSWLPAVFLLLVTAGLGGIYKVGTSLVARDRPPVRILDPGLVPDHSFPSGHVGTAVGVYAALAVLVWLLAPRLWPVTVLLALLPLVVAACRLYQGAHHVTDVLTSLTYGVVWLALVTRLVLVRPARPPTRRRSGGAVPG